MESPDIEYINIFVIWMVKINNIKLISRGLAVELIYLVER